MNEPKVTSGYLIEKTFARMQREFLVARRRLPAYLLDRNVHAIPPMGISAEHPSSEYRGLQREPILGWVEALRGSGVVEPTDSELAASIFLAMLTRAQRADDGFVFSLGDARALLREITPPVEREIVWARRMDTDDGFPVETVLLGYEPSTFYPPLCSSAIAQAMFFTCSVDSFKHVFPVQQYRQKLNRYGLFDTPTDAEEYLRAYLCSLRPDSDEHLNRYHICEVRALPCNSNSSQNLKVMQGHEPI